MEGNENPLDNMKDYYRIISQARALHIINKQRRICDKTRLNYQRIAERLIFKDKQLPIEYAKSKSTYYTYKAATASYILDAISQSVTNIDALKKSDSTAWEIEVNILKQYLNFLSVIGIDQDKRNLASYQNGNFQSEWSLKSNLEPKSKKSKKSKARRLKTLPKDWTFRLFNYALKSNTKHILAIATMAISGCRPQELAFGVELSLNEDQSISVLIHGAKTHNGLYGQAFRSFHIEDDSVEFRYLHEQLQSKHNGLIVTADPGAICDKIAYLSRKAIPQLKEVATAYCYRHRFSGSLHHAGLDTQLIAKALGHSTDQSQQQYSTAFRTGAIGFKICNIKSARPIKAKNSVRAAIKQSNPTLH